MGLRQLGELRRLPRAGLARRFGEGLLDELDSASGDRPDPREAVVLPRPSTARWSCSRAPTPPTNCCTAPRCCWRGSWCGCRPGMPSCGASSSCCGTRGACAGREGPAVTPVDVALAEPSRDAVHLQSLLRERLAAFVLPAPTLELALHARDIAKQPPPNTELFPTPRNEREGLVRLIERLQARLGPSRVQRLVRWPTTGPTDARTPCPTSPVRRQGARTGADRHAGPCAAGRGARAERAAASPAPTEAARAAGPSAEPERPAPSMRPVWLMPEPVPLAERLSRPLLDGQVLQLLCGPERIEAGWWDEGLAEGDYFIAGTAEGRWCGCTGAVAALGRGGSSRKEFG